MFLKKLFFAGICTLTTLFAFPQNVITDKEVIRKYAIATQQPALQKQLPGIFLVEVKAGSIKLIKIKYKDHILLQLNEKWFVIKSNAASLNKEILFEKILPASNNYKLSPAFLTKQLNKNSAYHFIIKVSDSSALLNYLRGYYQVQILSSYNKNFYVLTARLSFITDTLIDKDFVASADIVLQQPKEEMVINDFDNSVNAINLFYARYPSINGDGLSASVKENLFDTTDIDFKNRYQLTSNSSPTITTHATTMATIIGGGGNSFKSGKGVAWSCKLSASDFANLLPDSKALYQQYGTSVQNHSYGTIVENFYGIDANAFDQSLLDNPNLVYVFSAGNSGALTDSSGNYNNLHGFANITGNFKQAKNIIIVGSVDSFYNIPIASSKGPAYDGRIKPELVAYGNDGSSGAAAITSGTAVAAQAAYKQLHHDSLPANALVKAILLNSADDVFKEGPDYYSGYGNVNTYKAIRDMRSGNYFSGNSKQDAVDSFIVDVPANTGNIKIMLVWNDAPATANAFTALVNDLDIEVRNNNTTWLPWVLNSNADSALLLLPAQRKRDSLNVVEQVTIAQPQPGRYKIYVKGYDVSTTAQPYYVVYEMDTLNKFQFITPSSADHFMAGNKGIIRWDETYSIANGKLEYSLDKGLSWITIAGIVALNNKYYNWKVPDTSAITLMRMTVGNDIYVSDTFDFSAQLSPKVIINCSDSVLINWHKIKGISKYKVLQLGAQYLQDYATLNDTSIVIKNSTSAYIAVAPVFDDGRTGINSYTFNFNTQGAGCYINNFLADLTADNKASLQLVLGTIINVDSIEFQRFLYGKWQNIQTVSPVTNTTVRFLFDGLINGINTFRAIVWVNGNQVASNTASISFFMQVDFIAKPNPLPQGHNLSVLSTTLVNGTLVVYDVLGRKLLQQDITGSENIINTASLARGVYFLVVYDEDKHKVFKGKLVID